MSEVNFKTEYLDKSLPVTLVELEGYIDQSNCDQLQKIFDNLYSSENYKLVFEMSNLEYVSSAGWGIFVGEVKRFRDRGGDIKLTGMKPEIYEVFQMLEFYHILDEYMSIEDALEAYKGGKKSISRKKVLGNKNNNQEEFLEEDNITYLKDEDHHEQSNLTLNIDDDEFEIGDDSSLDKNYEYQTSSIDSTGSLNEDFQENIKGEKNIAKLPVQEKVKKIVAMDPLLSFWQIKKVLTHKEFGNIKIGFLKLYRLLKSLELETKTKRYRYYRSC